MDRDQELVRMLRAHSERLEIGGELSGREIAEALKALTEREVEEGGPYRLLEDVSHIDLGMNLVVSRFLSACDVELPNLRRYIDRALDEGVHESSLLDETELREEAGRFAATDIGTHEEDGQILYDAAEASVLDEVHAAMDRRLADSSTEIREGAAFIIGRTIRANPDKQMSLMAEYVRRALGERGKVFTDAHLGELGFANACFWSSFIVYDDFWDEDEAAEASLLPVANLLARHYVRYFTELFPEEEGLSAYFHELMDRLDAANAWETVACRMHVEGDIVTIPDELPAYGDFGVKFYPAAGHVMGPVAMLVALGYAIGSEEVSALVDYFENYLVAMQLNDDAHDWKEDLARGHISTAVSVLLAVWKEEHPERREIDLVRDMPELERLFWFRALGPVCEAVLERTQRAKTALKALSFLEDLAPLERFIVRNEAVARKALREREQSDEFISVFLQEELMEKL